MPTRPWTCARPWSRIHAWDDGPRTGPRTVSPGVFPRFEEEVERPRNASLLLARVAARGDNRQNLLTIWVRFHAFFDLPDSPDAGPHN